MKKENRIVIAGCGRLGKSIAAALCGPQNQLTVIDPEEDALDRVLWPLPDSVTIKGDPGDMEILKKADIQSASVVIAATGDDSTNFFVAQVAKEIYGVPKVIALLNDICYDGLYRQSGIRTICPESLSVAAVRDEVIA